MTAAAGDVGAVVLAAGLSRRAGEQNKLLFDWQGRTVLRTVVDTVAAADIGDIIVVLGHQSDVVRAAIADAPVRCIVNERYAEGMAGSIARGIMALPAGLAGALICLGDMPALRAGTLIALVQHFRANGGSRPCLPVHDGRRGNPVLWPRAAFDALRALSGDRGAKALLTRPRWAPLEVPVDDVGIHRDIDTAEDLAAGADRP